MYSMAAAWTMGVGRWVGPLQPSKEFRSSCVSNGKPLGGLKLKTILAAIQRVGVVSRGTRIEAGVQIGRCISSEDHSDFDLSSSSGSGEKWSDWDIFEGNNARIHRWIEW